MKDKPYRKDGFLSDTKNILNYLYLRINMSSGAVNYSICQYINKKNLKYMFHDFEATISLSLIECIINDNNTYRKLVFDNLLLFFFHL